MDNGWHAWTTTAAFYNKHDPLSFAMALTSLVPIVVLIFVSGFASAPSARQMPALILLMGFVFNAALNAVLKALIQSPRPVHPASGSVLAPSAHGMPSDHAQFLFFFATWLMRRAAATGVPMGRAMQAFLIASAVCVSCSRVYNGFHDPAQVIVGALVGTASAYLCTTACGEALLRRVALAIIPIRDVCIAWTAYIR